MFKNRKLRRELSKKLGEDFPLDKMLSLAGYYNREYGDDLNRSTIRLLSIATEQEFTRVNLIGGFDDWEEVAPNSFCQVNFDKWPGDDWTNGKE